MAFGINSTFDMINRMKRDRASRPSKRPKFMENNRDGNYTIENNPEKLNFKTLPQKELDLLKKGIRDKARSEKRKELIISGILIFGIVTVIIYVITLLS